MKPQNLFSGEHYYDAAKEARFKPHPLLQCVIFWAFFFASTVLAAMPSTVSTIVIFLSDAFFPDDPAMADSLSLISYMLGTSIPITLIIIYCKFVERRSVASLGFKKEGCIKLYLIGLLFGMAAISATVGICCAVGAASYNGNVFSNAPIFAVICIGWVFQGAEEEILCRGWLMTTLSTRLPIWAAVLINSLFFALGHLGNSGFGPIPFVNLMLCGLWFSLLAIRCDSLIPCCAAHSIWNLAQGCIFGISVSGSANLPSVWSITFIDNRELWSGGSFGAEGGLACTVVLAAAALATWLLPKRKKETKEAN